eukprot:366220-Chlamydomonas_euryale.AAC.1
MNRAPPPSLRFEVPPSQSPLTAGLGPRMRFRTMHRPRRRTRAPIDAHVSLPSLKPAPTCACVPVANMAGTRSRAIIMRPPVPPSSAPMTNTPPPAPTVYVTSTPSRMTW